MISATVFDIERGSYADGPGIRTTVFFKGCDLRCVWCHNPESRNFTPEMMFYRDKCTNCGKCRQVCPHQLEKCDLCGKCTLYCPADARKICGGEYTVREIFNEVVKDRSYYDDSGGGVTLSGGECLCRADFCAELLKKLKENGINTAVDTCGHVPREALDRVIPYTDLFLYDIKAIDEDVHIKCTGRGNKLILDNLRYLDSLGRHVEIRFPFVPGYNSDQTEKIKVFLKTLKNRYKVKVLPYHNYAGSKYEALGIDNTLPCALPSSEEVINAQKCFM